MMFPVEQNDQYRSRLSVMQLQQTKNEDEEDKKSETKTPKSLKSETPVCRICLGTEEEAEQPE